MNVIPPVQPIIIRSTYICDFDYFYGDSCGIYGTSSIQPNIVIGDTVVASGISSTVTVTNINWDTLDNWWVITLSQSVGSIGSSVSVNFCTLNNSIRYADFVRLTTRNRYTAPFTIGQEYTILSLGTTDFTSIGASSNTIGVTFTATGVGSGTGVATQPKEYLFSTAPSAITVKNSTPTSTGTYVLDLYGGTYGYEYFLYSATDPQLSGIEIGQTVIGNYIQAGTQVIAFLSATSEPGYDWAIQLSLPTTTPSNTEVTETVSFYDFYETFDGLGQLVQIGAATRDIKSTANETTFTLVGIDTSMLSLVLGTDIKGSMIEAWHGFFDTSGALITTGGTGGLYKYFTGYINSFSITEQWMDEVRMYVGAVTVNASAIQIILRNRVAGRYTNDASWKFFTPTDNSMGRVAFISTINYYFGKNT